MNLPRLNLLKLKWWGFRQRLLSRAWALLHRCEYCGSGDSSLCGAATSYHWDGKGENPNRSFWACRICAEDYHSYWKERWDEYYSGLL